MFGQGVIRKGKSLLQIWQSKMAKRARKGFRLLVFNKAGYRPILNALLKE